MANLPTLLFISAAAGWLALDHAVLLSHAFCVALLVVLGARAGWVIDRRVLPAALGGLFAGGVGIALSLLKLLIH